MQNDNSTVEINNFSSVGGSSGNSKLKKRLFVTTGNLSLLNALTIIFNTPKHDDYLIIFSGLISEQFRKANSQMIKIHDFKEVEFIEELSYNGSAVMKASYKKEVSYNLLCFWRIKLAEDDVPNIEEMTNCLAGESYCGIFVANYGGHQYKIPDNRRKNMADGFYSMYITCSHFVPSPVYFSKVKNIMTKEIISQSFSGKFLYINYIYLVLFISLLL